MAQGVMYVEILPTTKNIGKAVEKDATKGFKSATREGDTFFSKVGKGLKRVGIGIGVAATAVAGLAVKGGISRALNIEDATAKLKGLGHDTKAVDQIMTDALASVKGTAFGLDAAATTAASAVAAGIKPGQELEKYLRLTADAATIAGVSMDEMGDLMNKVAAKGKVSAREINMFTERGIPIIQMLAKEYGVSAEELSEMVSRGEVDAKRFRKALEDNVGGAALESGNTTRGAFANMRAALSRLGLAFIGDGLSGAKTFFNEVTVILDGLTDRVGPWVERVQSKLGEMFQIEGFGENFLDWLDETLESISSGPLPKLFAALAPLLPLVAELSKMLGTALGDAFYELGEALAPVLPLIAEELVNAVVELLPPLTDLLVALLPLVPPLVELLAAVVPLATAIIGLLVPAIKWLVEQLEPAIQFWGELFDLLSGNASWGEFLESLGLLGEKVWGIREGAQAVFNAMQTLSIAFTNIATHVSEVWSFVSTIFTTMRDFISDTWEAIGLVTGGALQVIVGLVTGNMGMVRDGINQALGAIRTWWSNTWNGLTTTLSSAWGNIRSAASSHISSLVATMSALPGRIMGALGNLGSMLFGVGQDMIQGLINGVGSMIDSAVAAVQEVGGSMLAGVKSFLGIKSPSRVFRDEVGKMVGAGLLEGIEDRSIAGRIDSAVNHLVSIPGMESTTGNGSLVDSITINGSQDSRIVSELMFALRTTARGGVYAR